LKKRPCENLGQAMMPTEGMGVSPENYENAHVNGDVKTLAHICRILSTVAPRVLNQCIQGYRNKGF